MNGNGSQRYSIVDANTEILDILSSSGIATKPYINIELRPLGIIIHFRVRLDNWALILPYHTLNIFSQNNRMNIYSGKWKLSFSGYRQATIRLDFIQKVIELKGKATLNH